METKEHGVKKKVTELLKKYEIYYFFPATHGYGRSGVPDIICCIRGYFLAIECKSGKNTPTALQLREINLIQKAKGIAFVVNENNIEELHLIIKEILRK
ncbi:VRR-NUC domain-containing protein [bacterium]|nr:VRR-NUC domain-containing protein [bacterium]